MKYALTLTTVNVPRCVEAFANNFLEYGHANEVVIVVVGDEKTPDIEGHLVSVEEKTGVRVEYFSAWHQRDYLKTYPTLDKILPWNSFARRNIGDLYAYELGAEVIIRVDDDNFPVDGVDYLKGHAHVGTDRETPCFKSDSGWYNCCQLLEGYSDHMFYPRGWPMNRRTGHEFSTRVDRISRTGINAGLWIDDPDVDAITRIANPPRDVTGQADEFYGEPVRMDTGTWCPINTQNTAYHRRLIPAAFVAPNMGRYDDIWSGYILRAIMDHMGDSVTYGPPLVRQERNVHNLLDDLAAELDGMRYTPRLIEVLRGFKLRSTSYATCLEEVADVIAGSDLCPKYTHMVDGMRVWAEIFA